MYLKNQNDKYYETEGVYIVILWIVSSDATIIQPDDEA